MKHQFKFMPMYWLDHDIDTQHLSTLQQGAYLLLISYYWRSGGPVPDDDILLSRVTRLSSEEWREMKPTICRFFYFDDGFWRHKRIERELDEARALSERKRAAVNKRWRKDEHVVIQLLDKKG